MTIRHSSKRKIQNIQSRCITTVDIMFSTEYSPCRVIILSGYDAKFAEIALTGNVKPHSKFKLKIFPIVFCLVTDKFLYNPPIT